MHCWKIFRLLAAVELVPIEEPGAEDCSVERPFTRNNLRTSSDIEAHQGPEAQKDKHVASVCCVSEETFLTA